MCIRDSDKDYPIQLIMLDATTGDMIDLKDVLNQQTYDSSVVDSVIDLSLIHICHQDRNDSPN